MTKICRISVLCSLALSALCVAAQGKRVVSDQRVFQQYTERSGHFDHEMFRQDMFDTYTRLLAEQGPVTPENLISIEVTDKEIAALDHCDDCGERKVRVGLTKPALLNLDFTGLEPTRIGKRGTMPASGGMMRQMGDGGYTWTTAVESPKAVALRVKLIDVNLPEGAELFIYNDEGEAFGPYTGKGPNGDGSFWTNTVSGSMAYLQLRQYGQPSPVDLHATELVISDVAHLGPQFLLPFYNGKAQTSRKICSFNENCIEDANCHSNSATADARDAIAHMQYISGAFIYICSGGLVADSDSSSQIPYFLTANHCISKNNEANSLECFWQFSTSGCNGSCYSPDGAVPRTLGASILAKNRTGDFTFMQLAQNPPSGSAFLGWSTAAVHASDNEPLYRISHPSGAPQAYTEHSVDANSIVCSSWPRGDWIYSKDVVGATEGGSSGAPVLNSNGQIVGQLSGACGYNVNTACDTESNWTVDGAFVSYYSSVQQWLGGGSTPPGGGTEMHVASIVLSTKSQGPRDRGRATVVIVDENGDPVSGATVTGTFTGDITATESGTTDSNGEVTLQTNAFSGVTTFGFCVDSVSGSLTYNASANVETCDTF